MADRVRKSSGTPRLPVLEQSATRPPPPLNHEQPAQMHQPPVQLNPPQPPHLTTVPNTEGRKVRAEVHQLVTQLNVIRNNEVRLKEYANDMKSLDPQIAQIEERLKFHQNLHNIYYEEFLGF